MAFVLLFLSSFFLKPALSAIVFEEVLPYTCDGNVPYNKAPIKFYYNKTSRFCLAVRAGCEGQQQKPLYDTLEICIEKEFQDGYKKSGTGRCMGEYSGKTPISFTYGSTKTKVPYLMSGCYPEERMCPEDSGCFYEKTSALATCCSKTQDGPSFLAAKWAKSFL